LLFLPIFFHLLSDHAIWACLVLFLDRLALLNHFLGGYLTDSLNWRWVFYVNMPIGIPAGPVLSAYYANPREWHQSSHRLVGAGTLVLSVVPLLLALTLDKEIHAWDSPVIIGLLTMAAVFGALLILRRNQSRLADCQSLSLFKDQIFSVTMLSSFLNGAAFFGAFLFLSLFLVNVSVSVPPNPALPRFR
jgi:predicted MFS family arabinose efflux permease